jgi:hypothetical protein
MNIIKFPKKTTQLSPEEQQEIARQELLEEIRQLDSQGLLHFEYMEQSEGQVINFPGKHTNQG